MWHQQLHVSRGCVHQIWTTAFHWGIVKLEINVIDSIDIIIVWSNAEKTFYLHIHVNKSCIHQIWKRLVHKKLLNLRIIFQTEVQKQLKELFCRKPVVRNFTKSTGKHLCQSPLCFLVNFAKFVRTLFLQNTSGGCFWRWCHNHDIINSVQINFTFDNDIINVTLFNLKKTI